MMPRAVSTPHRPKPDAADLTGPTLRLTGHRPALDGVRGVAILMVLAFHFLPTDLPPAPGGPLGAWAAVAGLGASGVDLFFVLSGFLITGILLDAQGAAGHFRNFYARRALRILPLYYAVLFACFVVLPHLHRLSPDEQLVAHRQGWLWTFTANLLAARLPDWPFNGGRLSLDAYWSLCVEEHFYLVWPFATYLLSRRALAWTCAALIVAAPALRWTLYARGDPTLAFYVFTPCRTDGLAAGALLAVLARRPDGGNAARRWALPALLLAVAWAALTWRAPSHTAVYATSQATLFFAAALVLAVTTGPRHPLARALTVVPLRFFGKYSYAIYVLHPLLLKNVVAELLSLPRVRPYLTGPDASCRRTLAMLALGLASSAAAGWCSWHLVEKHFLKFKRYFEYRPNARS